MAVEVAFHEKLDSAFRELNKKIDDRVDNRTQHKKAEAVLRQELNGLREEQQRLLQELTSTKAQNETKLIRNKAELAEETKRLTSMEQKREYWRSVADVMRSFFHVDFKCNNPEKPTQVTIGFFKDSMGVCQRSIPVCADDTTLSVADIDYNWKTVESVHLSKSRKRPSE